MDVGSLFVAGPASDGTGLARRTFAPLTSVTFQNGALSPTVVPWHRLGRKKKANRQMQMKSVCNRCVMKSGFYRFCRFYGLQKLMITSEFQKSCQAPNPT